MGTFLNFPKCVPHRPVESFFSLRRSARRPGRSSIGHVDRAVGRRPHTMQTPSNADGYEIRFIDETVGYGVFATKALPAGTRLFEEYPLVAMQHAKNKKDGVITCDRCFRFLGPLEAQIGALLRANNKSLAALPAQLPTVDGVAALPQPVACPGGSDLRFCSEACAQANYADHHRLFCGPCAPSKAVSSSPPTDAATAASKRSRPDAAAERASMARIAPPIEEALDGLKLQTDAVPSCVELCCPDVSDSMVDVNGAAAGSSQDANGDGGLESLLSSLPTEDPRTRFAAHASATNEIFHLAGKACAHVLCKLDGLPPDQIPTAYENAMKPFCGPPWWEAIPTPEEVTDEITFRRTLRGLLTESWTLLAAVLGRYAPPNCPLFTNDDAYSRIVGSFERRNCTVAVTSPVEAYLLAVDDLPEGAGEGGHHANHQPDTRCSG